MKKQTLDLQTLTMISLFAALIFLSIFLKFLWELSLFTLEMH